MAYLLVWKAWVPGKKGRHFGDIADTTRKRGLKCVITRLSYMLRICAKLAEMYRGNVLKLTSSTPQTSVRENGVMPIIISGENINIEASNVVYFYGSYSYRNSGNVTGHLNYLGPVCGYFFFI
jgi:hypothetical protein